MKTFIFDMDGVIVNSELLWKKKEHNFLKELIPDFSLDYQKDILWRSLEWIYQILDEKYNINVSKEEFIDMYIDFWLKNIYSNCELEENVVSVLRKIQNSPRKLALASSSPRPWINKVLEKFSLKKYFDLVVSADDLSGRWKPDPAIYLYVRDQLKETSENCIVIEDSYNGALAWKRANMTVWWYRNWYNQAQDLSISDRIIQKFVLEDF